MNRDPAAGFKLVKVERTALFQGAMSDVTGEKRPLLPQPNYDDNNLKGGGYQRNKYPNRRSENYRSSENSRERPYRGTYQTSARCKWQQRSGFYSYTENIRNSYFPNDKRSHFPKTKFNHNVGHRSPGNSVRQVTPPVQTLQNVPFGDSSNNEQSCIPRAKNIHTILNDSASGSLAAESDQSICSAESSYYSGVLESRDETVPPHCQGGCDPTAEVILSNCTELQRDAVGFQDGSSGYGSQDDVSINGSSCFKSSETVTKYEQVFGSSDLSESLTDGFIPPPTPCKNLICDESYNGTVTSESSSSCHEKNGTITTPVPISSVEDSCRESGATPESSTTDSTSSCDLGIQENISPEDKHICHFSSKSLDLITVPVEDSHSDECEETSAQESLNSMDMVPEQIEAIGKLLKIVEDDRSSAEYDTWGGVLSKLTRVVKKCIRGCWLEPFGSYVSGFAIGTSDINVALLPNNHINSSHKLLQEMVKPIQKDIPDSEAVYEGQDYRTAFVSFYEPKSNIFCKIQILGNPNLCMTAKLLCSYNDLDKRVKTLVVAVRHWATVCEIDEEEDGRLHPLNYVLMMIHFLQQCDPPVLPVIDPKNRKKFKEMKTLEDDNQEVGYLWMEFLKYYSETFNWKDNVVSITSKDPVLKASKTWGKCWIAVEEPYDAAVNVAKSVVSQDVSNYIRTVFTKTYNYFLHPVTSDEFDTSCDLTDDSSSNKLSTDATGGNQPSFDYDFYQDNFLNGLLVPVVCYDCEHLGHVCDACLHDENSMLHSLPKLTEEFLCVVDEALKSMYEKDGLSELQLKKRENLVERLEKHLRTRLKNCKVELIGSSKSGFGLKDSDVDLCFTLEGKSAESVDAKVMVRKIKSILLRNSDFTDIMFICSSKIPIVKFIDRRTRLRCDISIYNELAVYNTRLLNAYSKIDRRVKILGFAMKNLAKNACINDTAQRTLSSYSYILMVLYFLQQVEPPVIPVLQELYDTNEPKPEKIVENEDVYFFDDIENLGSVWDGTGKNQKSAGNLWIELLEFYTTKFDFHHFISISQKSLLTELKTVSSSMLFNIQDPFIRGLNLGRRMSGDMSRRTLRALQRARILFGTPVPTAKPPSGFESFQDYFFSTLNLTDGRVTGHIECSLCGKFGHSDDNCRRHKLNPNRFWSKAPYKPRFQRNS